MTTKKSKEQLLLSFYAHQTEKSLHTDYNDAPEVHRPSFQYQAREDMSRPRNENKLPEIKPSPRDSSKAERIFNTSFVNDAMERNAIFTQLHTAMEQQQQQQFRPKLPGSVERLEREQRQQRLERQQWQERLERQAKLERQERLERLEREERHERSERQDMYDRHPSQAVSWHSGSAAGRPQNSKISLFKDKINQRYSIAGPQADEQASRYIHAPPIAQVHERMTQKSQDQRRPQDANKEQHTSRYLIRHYHKQDSVMYEALCRFIEHLDEMERILQGQVYKLSIFDTLETMKLKMENYMERKINLGNIASEKPVAEWQPEEFTRFYTLYRPVLIRKDTETKQIQGKEKVPITLKKYKNCVYFGSIVNGNKQGDGILHYFTGKFFQGNFKDDQKDEGLEIDESELYLGEFKKGLRHGQGILKDNQALYVGVFNEGRFGTTGEDFGQQTPFWCTKKGFEISYSAIRVFANGMTVMKNSSKDIFVGKANENGEKDGDGLEVFANGDIYIGRYEAGSPEGYGEYYWLNGAHYRGQFLSGMRHGRGIWRMTHGDCYDGEYMNDKKSGKGIYEWKNGSRYIGSFENDYRHGYGQMYWQDGRVYKGQWLNGIEKGTVIKLDIPKGGRASLNKAVHSKSFQAKPGLRSIQHDRKIPLDKLKSIYSPSHLLH